MKSTSPTAPGGAVIAHRGFVASGNGATATAAGPGPRRTGGAIYAVIFGFAISPFRGAGGAGGRPYARASYLLKNRSIPCTLWEPDPLGDSEFCALPAAGGAAGRNGALDGAYAVCASLCPAVHVASTPDKLLAERAKRHAAVNQKEVSTVRLRRVRSCMFQSCS